MPVRDKPPPPRVVVGAGRGASSLKGGLNERATPTITTPMRIGCLPPSSTWTTIPVFDPELGKVPFWKSLLWATSKARTEMIRADSAAVGATSLSEEDKPPRLAADEEPIPPEVLSAIERRSRNSRSGSTTTNGRSAPSRPCSI